MGSLPAGSFFFDNADAISRRAQPDSPIAGFTDYIQTDASRSGGSVGLGCAVPSNNARRAVDDFIEHGRIVYCWLGVGIEERTGALVVNVHRGSPAARAGVRRGDLITNVEGSETEDIADLYATLNAARCTVSVRVLREGTLIGLRMEGL